MARDVYLLTDFGDSPYTGILRALARNIMGGEGSVIDLDHSIPSFKILAGAYVLANTYYWTPRGSVIVAVVDPGVGGPREAIAVEAGDYILVGPNNGLLYPVISKEGAKRIVELDMEKVVAAAQERFRGKLPQGRWPLSHTFHARDVFLPAGALIAVGVDMEELGAPMERDRLKRLVIDYVEKVEGGFKARVVYIDKFGNIALSAKPGLLPIYQWRRVYIQTQTEQHAAMVGRKFSDVRPGQLVLYVNSFGHIELAVNQGNAARKLGVEIGDTIVLAPIE